MVPFSIPCLGIVWGEEGAFFFPFFDIQVRETGGVWGGKKGPTFLSLGLPGGNAILFLYVIPHGGTGRKMDPFAHYITHA